MKRASSSCLITLLLLSSAAVGQQYPPMPQKDRLEDDPTFQRLSPEKQAWVRQMTDRLDTAVKQRDTKALNQLKLDTSKAQLIGRKVCNGNTFDQTTYLDAVETSPTGQAFAVRWLDQARGATFAHTAVFTDSRCVASDGALLDGRRIFRVLPNSLAVSAQHGLVAYEALYFDPADDGKSERAYRRGVFIENRFLVDIDQEKASASPDDEKLDFWWREDSERLEMRPEIRVPASSDGAGRSPK